MSWKREGQRHSMASRGISTRQNEFKSKYKMPEYFRRVIYKADLEIQYCIYDFMDEGISEEEAYKKLKEFDLNEATEYVYNNPRDFVERAINNIKTAKVVEGYYDENHNEVITKRYMMDVKQ